MACSYWKLGLGYGHQNTAALSECVIFLSENVSVPRAFLPDLASFIPSSWSLSPAGDFFVLMGSSLY